MLTREQETELLSYAVPLADNGDQVGLRVTWLIVARAMCKRGDWKAVEECLYNAVRWHPPLYWRTGVKLFDVIYEENR